MTAARGGLEAGYGPSYVRTGTDVGVASKTASMPDIPAYQPMPIPGAARGASPLGALGALGSPDALLGAALGGGGGWATGGAVSAGRKLLGF